MLHIYIYKIMFCGRFVSLLHYLWVIMQFFQTESSTMVEIKLNNYTVPDGKEMVGNLCDSILSGNVRCDPYFSICLDQPDGDADLSKCTYRLISTSFYLDQNSIDFGNVINGGVENPINLAIPNWKGGIDIKVDVRDEDLQLDDPIDNIFQTWNQIPFRSKTFATWKDVTMKGNRRTAEKTILLLSIKVYCEQDWYGSDCTVKCEPRNGYICEENTGQLICNPGSTCASTVKTTITTPNTAITTNQPQNGGLSAGSVAGITVGAVAMIVVILAVVLCIKKWKSEKTEETSPNTKHSWAVCRNFRLFIIRFIRRPDNQVINVNPIEDRDRISALPAAEQRALPSTKTTTSAFSVTEMNMSKKFMY